MRMRANRSNHRNTLGGDVHSSQTGAAGAQDPVFQGLGERGGWPYADSRHGASASAAGSQSYWHRKKGDHRPSSSRSWILGRILITHPLPLAPAPSLSLAPGRPRYSRCARRPTCDASWPTSSSVIRPPSTTPTPTSARADSTTHSMRRAHSTAHHAASCLLAADRVLPPN